MTMLTELTTEPQLGNTVPAWWDTESEHVRAVLDLAWMRGNAGDEAFERIIAMFAPTTSVHLADVARMLYRIDRLECGLLDGEVGGDIAAQTEAEHLRDDAVLAADLIASLVLRGVR